MSISGLRVLIVEDENSVSSFLEKYFISINYKVSLADKGQLAIELIRNHRFEIVILDLGLPDMKGTDVLLQIRQWTNIPVIILTANDNNEDKVRALENGADDYLTKPFNINELSARVKAITRRTNQAGSDNKLRTTHLELSIENHLALFDNKELTLTQTEFEILKFLMMSNGKVVVHRTLLKNIWGPNSVEHTQYLRVYVGQLRKKLITLGAIKDVIVTETGVGYRLND